MPNTSINQNTASRNPTIKPGAEVTFAGLPEPVMTIVGIDAKKNLAICRYFDAFLGKDVRLECAPDSLAPHVKPA